MYQKSSLLTTFMYNAVRKFLNFRRKIRMGRRISKKKRVELLEEKVLLEIDIQDACRAGDEGGIVNDESMHSKEKRIQEIQKKLGISSS